MPAKIGVDGWVAGERPGDGDMRRVGDLYQARFIRLIPRPMEMVWAALTVPERLADWLGAPAELDLRVGGRYIVRFVGAPNDDGIYGVISEYDPPRLLAYDWADTGGDSNIRWELTPVGDGCRLTFTQTGITPWWFIGGFAGWHAFIDELTARLSDTAPPDETGEDHTYGAITARYRAWFGPFVEGSDLRPALRHHEPDGLALASGDGTYSLRFTRRYMLPIAKVWAALTEPERLADWFARAEIDPHLGGAVAFHWTDGHVERGAIVEIDPPNVIAWTTQDPDGRQSVVRWELTQEDPDFMGTRLVLTHTVLPTEHLLSIATGWHTHLDEFPDAAARETPLEWSVERQRRRADHELARHVPRYRARLPGGAADVPWAE